MDSTGRPPFSDDPDFPELSKKPAGTGTLELGSFDSVNEPDPTAADPSPQTPLLGGNSLQLALVEEEKYLRTVEPPREVETTLKDPEPEELSKVEVVTEEPRGSLGIEARALNSGGFSGVMVARRTAVSPWEAFRDNFIAMTIVGALLGLFIGGGITYYSSRSSLSEVKTIAAKREVAKKGAVLLGDSKTIDNLDAEEQSVRSSIALKGTLIWGGFFSLFFLAWVKYVA